MMPSPITPTVLLLFAGIVGFTLVLGLIATFSTTARQEPLLVHCAASLKTVMAEMAAQYGRKAGDIGITVREPFKIDERLPADRDRPFVGPRGHVLDSFHEFQQLGVSHMVIDLFYSTSVLEDATLESMIGAMEVLARDMRGIPGTHPEF